MRRAGPYCAAERIGDHLAQVTSKTTAGGRYDCASRNDNDAEYVQT
jgi:hypothetical protein